MLYSISKKIQEGRRLTRAEGVRLFKTDDIFTLGSLASFVSEKKNGKTGWFVRNRHINPTNICVNRCRFCAFSRSKGQEGAYELSIRQIIGKIEPLFKKGGHISEVHIVGGLHPDRQIDYYAKMLSEVKKRFPKLHIKAFTAVEIDYLAKLSRMTVAEAFALLKKSGLDTMPGGGAEIFDVDVRQKLCPEKISGKRWLQVMEEAHRAGIRTNATMLYGHIEGVEERVDHLLKLRELQDKTKGFQAFIPLAYHPKNTEIQGAYTSGIDDLRTIAASRLILDNFDHIKAYWIMLGEKISQLALKFGADDIDGTVIEEKITHSAGALTGESMTVEQMINLIRKAGKTPVERDSFYKKLKVFK